MKITKKDKEVIECLYLIRGIRAMDVAYFIYGEDYSKSNEKSAYNILRRLKEKQLVKRYRNSESTHATYELSKKGLELAKKYWDVGAGDNGNGLLPVKSDTTLWDVPYKIYCAPRYQLHHYFMTIDCAKQLYQINDIRFQMSYYCNLYYKVGNNVEKIKPDLGLVIKNKYYAIEVDTGTESLSHLINKFRKYKNYTTAQSVYKQLQAIIFVVPDLSERAMDRRWLTVMEAFYMAFDQQINTPINLIFTSLAELKNTIEFEKKRFALEDKYLQDVNNSMMQNGFEKYYEFVAYNGLKKNRVYVNNITKTYRPSYIGVHQKREIAFYYDKFSIRRNQDSIRNVCMPGDLHYGYRYNGVASIFDAEGGPVIPKGIMNLNLEKQLREQLLIFPEITEKYKL